MLNGINKILAVLVLSIVAIVLYSCGNAIDPAGRKSRIGMVADFTGYTDNGINQYSKSGLERARSDFSLDAEYKLSYTICDMYQNISYMLDYGFDLVIVNGSQFAAPAAQLASSNPSSRFIIMDHSLVPSGSNIESVVFAVDQAAFPLGFLAAAWANLKDTASPMVAWIVGFDSKDFNIYSAPFAEGVKYYNSKYGKNIRIKGKYAGTLWDYDYGKTLGASLAKDSVDVIFAAAGLTGNGVLAACAESGIWGIGSGADQYTTLNVAKGILLSSCQKNYDNAVYSIIGSFVAGSFDGGGVFTGNLANNCVAIAPYHDFESQIPQSVKNDIQSILTAIKAGTLSTGWQ